MRLSRTFLITALMSLACHAKHIVLIAGDQEYRSEESMPALARILETRHGFHCTVLRSINPSAMDNVPGLEALRNADLMILFTRYLELPDDQMKEIIDYTNSGRPIVGLRTATHAFNYVKHLDSPYAKYGAQNKNGGYGRQVLGETWIAHYGAHQKESTRGVLVAEQHDHPILRGVHDIWGESDVYEITALSGDSRALVLGQVLLGMDTASLPDPGKKLMPIAWIKTYTGAAGKTNRVFMTTLGHVMDFNNEGFRRLLVNACYWAMGMEKQISAGSNVDLVGEYKPSPIGLR